MLLTYIITVQRLNYMVSNVVPVFDMILFDEKGWVYFILYFNTNVNCYNKTFLCMWY